MSKPEGTAQEPQGVTGCTVSRDDETGVVLAKLYEVCVAGRTEEEAVSSLRSIVQTIAQQPFVPMHVPATPAPSQPAGARECDEEWPRSVEGVVQALAYLHGRATESGAGASMNLLPIPTAIYWLRELKQQTAAKDEEITRLTAFVSGDGEPDVMAAMWMADRAALPNGDTRDRFIEEARRLFRLNRTAQSDREAAERERDSLREANARLAADLDAALKAGKDGPSVWGDGMLVGQVAGLAGFDYANAEFIANARQDIPALLTELTALRQEVTRLTKSLAAADAYFPAAALEVVNLREENARLKGALANIATALDDAQIGKAGLICIAALSSSPAPARESDHAGM